MQHNKKNNQLDYRFAEGCAYRMKIHAGIVKDSGLIHSVVATAANMHDLTPGSEILHGEENMVDGDAGYQGVTKRPEKVSKIERSNHLKRHQTG